MRLIKSYADIPFTDGKATFVEGDKETDKLKNLGGDIAVGAEVSENVTIDVGYRYTDYGSFSKTAEDGKLKFDTKAHQILAGIRYNF